MSPCDVLARLGLRQTVPQFHASAKGTGCQERWLNLNDSDNPTESGEVLRIPRHKRDAVRGSHSGDEQVDCPRPSGFAALRDHSRVDQSVGTCGSSVEREAIECRFGALQPVLSSCSFCRVCSGVGTGSEFCHGDGGDCHLNWQGQRIDTLQVDDNRRVEDPLCEARLRHEGPARGLQPRRGLAGVDRGRCSVHCGTCLPPVER
jgi:hypothetical protein